MPAMVQGLAEDAGKTTSYDSQIGIGAPLQWNYNNHETSQGTPYVDAFPAGNHNTLIITEAVPLQNHLSYSDTYDYANNFYSYAKSNNNSNPVKFYLYETWHCINSGIPSEEPNAENGCAWDNSANSTTLWHPRLLADFPLWSGIVTSVRDDNPTDTEIWMVPAGQAFYNLTTEINDGNVPGIAAVTELFADDIHLTNAGNYFVACVMYATVYGESPVGLTQSINNQWGSAFTDMPTTAQALVMQEIAWETVTDLTPWTGVSVTVPVEWAQNTEAEVLNNKVKISFAAAHQINNAHFEIEHSLDGRTFKPIGKILGEEDLISERWYEFIHRNPTPGRNFYRVKQVDDDGKYTYGNITSVVYDARQTMIYPNPVNGELTVDSPSEDMMFLYNQLGQELLRKSLVKGINKVDMAGLNSGVYFARFGNGTVERMVKE
ncbi:hypothetical protein GCM10007940_32820 [Portibacter lacus]|uniref:Secretion system C-terminal sorting domain-containing protein n=2 Tax=Portibacter lacus TaxID=1099794 RepID=A0AA37STR7_9BACT|nr:hypothetical protein GCM10007940_32820 [Portibacter lacus]